jgi:hypothetical protein
MHNPLRIFIGYDSREPVSYHVLLQSLLRRASSPIIVLPLVIKHLDGLYTRKRNPQESTEFSLTRFLVPYLSGYVGHSIFMDCDMLCLTDITSIWNEIDKNGIRHSDPRTCPSEVVSVCKHYYHPKEGKKFLNQVQTQYPCKNWSSFMVFNNERCRMLTPEYVNTATPLELHQFKWAKEDTIGSLPLEWNWLVGEYDKPNRTPKIVHYTLGGPWWKNYADCDYAKEWQAERQMMLLP